MERKGLLIALASVLVVQVAISQKIGVVLRVLETESCEPVMFANVAFKQNSTLQGGVVADTVGVATIAQESLKNNSFEISSVGFEMLRFDYPDNSEDTLIVHMERSSDMLPMVDITVLEQPLYYKGVGCYGATTTSCSVQKMPCRRASDCLVDSTAEIKPAQSQIVSQISLYPNPTVDFVRVQNLEGVKELSIYDINGRFIESRPVRNSLETLDLSRQPSGTYFVSMVRNGTLESHKVVKM